MDIAEYWALLLPDRGVVDDRGVVVTEQGVSICEPVSNVRVGFPLVTEAQYGLRRCWLLYAATRAAASRLASITDRARLAVSEAATDGWLIP